MIEPSQCLMKKYEVTVPFTDAPWYTGYAMASSKIQAIAMVMTAAIAQGWKGRPGRATVIEVQ